MFRPLLVVLLALILAPGGIPLAVAQEATPAASPVASPVAGQPLDLAAMALRPSDLDTVGLEGFGVIGSRFFDLELEAAQTAEAREVPVEAILAPLQEAGFQRRYVSNLIRFVGSAAGTPTTAAGAPPVEELVVTSTITEYATARGAAAGFTFLEDETAHPDRDYRDVSGVRLGEQAELTRWSDVTPPEAPVPDLPYQVLNLTFREGNLVGDVIIEDFTNAEPDQALAEALAGVLRERMAAVQATGGPGLGELIARPAAAEGMTGFDGYVRLDGTTLPGPNSTADDLAALEAEYGATTTVYTYQAAIGDNPYLAVFFSRVPDAAAAGTWLAATRGPLPSTTALYVDVVEETGTTTIGESSRVFSYGFDIGGGTVVRGYAVFAQVGDLIARVQVDAIPGVSLAAVEALAAAQVACLTTGAPCPPLAVPDALVVAEAGASPVAGTPVAALSAGAAGPRGS